MSRAKEGNLHNVSDQLNAGRQEDLVWEIAIPLLSNRVMVGGMARVFAISGVIMSGLMAVLFGAQGDWALIVPISAGLLGLCVGLFVLSLLVMAVVFRNRMRFRFTIGHTGVRAETIDRTVRLANRLAVGAGVLAGSPQAVGAGLLSASRETEEARWSGRFRARYDDRARIVVLRNAWRAILYIYCTPENYAQVAERIRQEIEAHGTAERVPRRSPLGRHLGLSAVVVAACLPSFLLVDTLDVPLLIPLLLLCFALAMVWFIGLFGWVVLGVMVLEAGSVLVNGLDVRESFLRPGETYAHWTVFAGDTWALLVLAGASFVLLGGLSVRAIRGKMRSVLDADFVDMGG